MSLDRFQFSLRLLVRKRHASRWRPGKTARDHFTIDLPRFKRPVRCDPGGKRPSRQSMDEKRIESTFISSRFCRVPDKPEGCAMIDVAVGFIGNVDLVGLQRGQQFNQVTEKRTALVRNGLAMQGSMVVLLNERVGFIFPGR